MSSTRHPSRRSGGLPFPSSAPHSRSTQIQNHDAEPREDQQQTDRGHPTRSRVREELRDGEAQIRNREQGGPRIGVTTSPDEPGQRREQWQYGERAQRQGVTRRIPARETRGDRG